MAHNTLVSDKMFATLNIHFNFEMDSAYTYLALSAACYDMKWHGAAYWFHQQFREEHEHGMRVFEYIVEKHGKVMVEGVKKPQPQVNSLLECFQLAFQHEQSITKRINEIVGQAFDERDFGTFEFMQWFLAEQRREESSVDDIVDRLEMAGDDIAALLRIDERLLGRSPFNSSEEGNES